MRLIEKLSWKLLAARLNGAYRKMLGNDDSKLIIRDIVGFSKLGLYEPGIAYTPEQLIELRGRQQMALHILRHMDISVIEQIEHQNDAQAAGSYLHQQED